jgi:hypothetical protein
MASYKLLRFGLQFFLGFLMNKSTSSQLSIEYIAIDQLQHDPHNARKHPRSQIDDLQAIIREVGFIDPAIIDHANVIQCGNGAVQAARELGLTQIPCVRITNLSESQLRAFRIAHNRLAEQSEWDHIILRQEINLLPLDLIPLTGFNPSDYIGQMSISNPFNDDSQSNDQTQEDPAPYTVKQDNGIKVPIMLELTKAQVIRARAIAKALNMQSDMSALFLYFLNQYNDEGEAS